MPTLIRDDGTEIHWEERGNGPLVLFVVHWSGHPTVFAPLSEELLDDHRVVTYDARGTGQSTRTGPHDMSTGAADLSAVLREAGGSAVLVTLADGCNRAVRAASGDPTLVRAVVAPGAVPFPQDALAEADAMIASDSVVDGFLEMLSTDYRAAQRTLMTMANVQMTEAEIRDRVNEQVAYCPRETALGRVRAWRDDDPLGPARETGDRLWILSSPEMAGPWFPASAKLEALIAKLLPDAHVAHVEDGIVSRPDLTADVVHRLTSKPAVADRPSS